MEFCSAQYNKRIEESNGFKEFKLGDPYGKWVDDLVFIDLYKGMKAYKYDGDCCRTVLNHKIETIRLYFKENKIQRIDLALEKIHWKGPNPVEYRFYSYYEQDFEGYFGEPDVVQETGGAQFAYQWSSKSAVVQLNTYYGATFDGYMTAQVYIVSRSVLNNVIDGFK